MQKEPINSEQFSSGTKDDAHLAGENISKNLSPDEAQLNWAINTIKNPKTLKTIKQIIEAKDGTDKREQQRDLEEDTIKSIHELGQNIIDIHKKYASTGLNEEQKEKVIDLATKGYNLTKIGDWLTTLDKKELNRFKDKFIFYINQYGGEHPDAILKRKQEKRREQ